MGRRRGAALPGRQVDDVLGPIRSEIFPPSGALPGGRIDPVHVDILVEGMELLSKVRIENGDAGRTYLVLGSFPEDSHMLFCLDTFELLHRSRPIAYLDLLRRQTADDETRLGVDEGQRTYPAGVVRIIPACWIGEYVWQFRAWHRVSWREPFVSFGRDPSGVPANLDPSAVDQRQQDRRKFVERQLPFGTLEIAANARQDVHLHRIDEEALLDVAQVVPVLFTHTAILPDEREGDLRNPGASTGFVDLARLAEMRWFESAAGRMADRVTRRVPAVRSS